MTFLQKLRLIFTFGQGVALPLPEISDEQDPIEFFKHWFEEANDSGILLPEAMSVSTCSADGQPSSRMVLLKDFDQQGFVFYTNYGSRKSQDLAENQKVALLFHWSVLQRQVRIEGVVEKVDRDKSEAYFHSRDRGSQIGAWASKQSQRLNSRDELKQREQQFKEQFSAQEVPLPEFWGGFRIRPQYMEFWQGRANRLHDRVCFQKQDDAWQHFNLYP
ncbi:pyridoxamine 5'-phosphate oxidase [Thalassotalea maritima]|uniref:pyridoxamine 5'-phosphate oxidase n=1 Tax=Thalassotalea maritima TaxID=3242416 RepID=UPI0035281223